MRTTMTVPRLAAPAGGIGIVTLLLAAVLAAGAPLAAQTPAVRGQTRAKKVWTEDDLLALRTPADLYERRQAQKAEAARIAREAEEGARKDAAAHAQPPEAAGTATPETAQPEAVAPAAPSTDSIPTGLEAVQKRIEVFRRQVSDLELDARKRLDDLNTAREDQKAEASKRNADANDRLDKARVELQLLEARLQELKPPGS